MSDDFIKTLDIVEFSFDESGLRNMTSNQFVNDAWPVTYIIKNEKEVYVGESTNVFKRMKRHLKTSEKRKLTGLCLITSNKFNKSSVLDIESSLIKYLAADGVFKLQNIYVRRAHTYYQKDIYTNLFKSVWAALIDKGIAKQQLIQIDNSDLFKYSPYKSLTTDQHEAIIKIIQFIMSQDNKSLIIEGGAGTGKTILAIYLMKLLHNSDLIDETILPDDFIGELSLIKQLKKKYPKLKAGLVIPVTSLRKTLKRVFKQVKGLTSAMVIGPSQVVDQKYDLLIVDEAHRLHRRIGITNYASFNNVSLALGFDKDKATELDWIKKQSKHQILFYDSNQSIRPSDVPTEQFKLLKKERENTTIKLHSQLRSKGGLDYVNFVSTLFDTTTKTADISLIKDYEIKHFCSIQNLTNALSVKEKKHGLCRLVAGFAWKWQSKKKKQLFDIEIEDQKFRWNTTNLDWINSKNATKEIGCIHTTQGYDLNYVGVIFGPEISYSKTQNKIIIKKENYFDRNGKISLKSNAELEKYIVNIYKTLLLRGILGTYIYVCDKNLREYLQQIIPLS